MAMQINGFNPHLNAPNFRQPVNAALSAHPQMDMQMLVSTISMMKHALSLMASGWSQMMGPNNFGPPVANTGISVKEFRPAFEGGPSPAVSLPTSRNTGDAGNAGNAGNAGSAGDGAQLPQSSARPGEATDAGNSADGAQVPQSSARPGEAADAGNSADGAQVPQSFAASVGVAGGAGH